MIPAYGTVIHYDVPCPQGDCVPLLDLEARNLFPILSDLCAYSFAGLLRKRIEIHLVSHLDLIAIVQQPSQQSVVVVRKSKWGAQPYGLLADNLDRSGSGSHARPPYVKPRR